MSPPLSRGILLSVLIKLSHCGLLGYGTGEGSCAAAPFRSQWVKWSYGCPAFAPCCSEFGYCRPLSEWEYGAFRDCNGVQYPSFAEGFPFLVIFRSAMGLLFPQRLWQQRQLLVLMTVIQLEK